MTDQVILDIVLFFKRHSYPHDELIALLKVPDQTLYDLYSYVCTFLNSLQEVSRDAIFLDDINFLLTYHDLPIPADIYQNFLAHLEIWKKD